MKMFPSGRSLDTAQLDALYFGTSDGTNSAQRIFLTNETLENISLHDVTYISVEDLQLTQVKQMHISSNISHTFGPGSSRLLQEPQVIGKGNIYCIIILNFG